MDLNEFQKIIERTYFSRDSKRGVSGTFMWFAEEVGELASAIREGKREEMKKEFADVLAWLCSIASLTGIEMNGVISKYEKGCPLCGRMPCECPENF
jgi:NTP pyrophosphatase (non-canonical NTP hydrolase)